MLIFFFIIILSALFYVERTAILDVSFLLYHILGSGELAIQNNRFIAAIPQLIPFITAKLGLPLNSIMLLFSMTFVIINFIYYLLLKYILKSNKLALVILLMQFFMVSETFFWIQSELIQGLSLLIVYFGIILNFNSKSTHAFYTYSLIFIISFALVFSHFAIIFPITFLFIYFYIRNPSLKIILPISFGFYCLYFIRLILISNNVYDTSSLMKLNNIYTLFPYYFDTSSWHIFIKDLFFKYYFFLAGFIVVLLYYLYHKRYLLLGLYMTSISGYLFIINCMYHDSNSSFYLESFYLILGVMTIVPLVFDIIATINLKVVYIGISIMFIVKVVDISYTRQAFKARNDYLLSIIEKMNDRQDDKLIIQADSSDIEALMMTWGSSFEAWLLSTTQLGQTKSLLIDESIVSYDYARTINNAFKTKWCIFSYNNLPERYFKFTNDTLKYHLAEGKY